MNKHYLISPFTHVVFKLFPLIIFPSQGQMLKLTQFPKVQDGDREEEKGLTDLTCPDVFQMSFSSLVLSEFQLP